SRKIRVTAWKIYPSGGVCLTTTVGMEGSASARAARHFPAQSTQGRLQPMRLTRRAAVAVLAVAAFAVSAAAGTGSALAAQVTPLQPTALLGSVPTGPMLHGVTAGGAPWSIKPSSLTLFSNGGLVVDIDGLVIPALGTPGPVTEVNVSLFCGTDT